MIYFKANFLLQDNVMLFISPLVKTIRTDWLFLNGTGTGEGAGEEQQLEARRSQTAEQTPTAAGSQRQGL